MEIAIVVVMLFAYGVALYVNNPAMDMTNRITFNVFMCTAILLPMHVAYNLMKLLDIRELNCDLKK